MVKESTEYKREHKADFGNERIEILYEDQYIAVINKPSGMLSVPYPGSRARTAIEVLEQIMRKNGTYSAEHKPYVVHRLDRDTSGVMMFAMTEAMQKKIMASWQKMVTERLYRAVAENPKGQQLPDSGIINDSLAYNAYNIGFVPKAGDRPSQDVRRPRQSSEKSVYEKHLDFSEGTAKFKTVEARTHFRVVERGSTHTMFELSLDTGKKNQIRAHLASKGYPLAGDENYRAHTDPFGRLALHARTLEFNHPATGQHMKFEVPESEEWLAYVKKGDEHPVLPVWQNTEYAKKESVHRQHQEKESYVSRKKISGMYFIARGKMRSTK